MRKRSLCVLTVAALAMSAALTGCGGSTSAQTQQETTVETEKPAEETASADTTVIDAATEAISKPEPEPIPEPEPEPEPELPRSPLTGKVMDEELLKQRPLAFMFPINKQAQPQYGLDRVDVFYEIMEEGNMSRQMGIMQDWQDLERIGNVRSIRSYFVYEALEWDPIIIHFGGPSDYTGEILSREDVDNINGTGHPSMGPDYGAFYRIPHDGVAIEHTAYTDAERILDAIDEAGFEKEHREEYYHDKYYDPEDHLYYKTLYGDDQCDAVTGEQMAFTNIFIQRAEWVYANNDSREWEDGTHGYLWFRIEDPGYDGFYITNGKMIHVTWNKEDDYEPTLFYDDNGNEITVNQGRSMIFIIRDDRDDFDIDGITYYPDDHATITAPREDASEGSTEEDTAPAEEPEFEEM